MSEETNNRVNRPLKPLCFVQNVTLGCDPEFFFVDGRGKVVGSEKVLPEDGTSTEPADYMTSYHPPKVPNSKFIRDGIQAELNPRASSCRALLGNEIRNCFQDLFKILANKGVAADFSQCVEVEQAEMDTLSDKSKVFGCAPSVNCYTGGESQIKVDPKVYRGRSAGGHIHIGNCYLNYLTNCAFREQLRAVYELNKDPYNAWKIATRVDYALKTTDIIVPVLDIVLGNTCVLLDRAPSNKERRKVYGKAGEHRVKDYGIEYRVLSNFWLRSYQLMSMVMGISRLVVHLVEQSTPENDYVKALFDAVKRDDVIKAINENDFDLALRNFKAIENILFEACGTSFGNYPFNARYRNAFYFFINKGIDLWFEKDVVNHWMRLPEGHGNGWESFLQNKVVRAMYNEMSKTSFNLNPPKPPLSYTDAAAYQKYNIELQEYNKLYIEATDPTNFVITEIKDPTAVVLPVVAEETVAVVV